MSLGNQLSKFDIDLSYGLHAENLLRDLLGGEAKLEVKRESKSHYTGNVFIELTSHGEPSGIQTTDADWWVIAMDDAFGRVARILMIPVDRLRAIVSDQPRRIYTGDNNRCYGAIVPLADICKPL